MQSIASTKEAATVPDGLHHRRGVEYLAAAAGMEPDQLGAVAIFDERIGFSQPTAFIKSSDGRGYYRTTLKTCTCPSFKFRGGPCKHQKLLSERLERKARIDERNRQLREERARTPRPSTSSSKGFNLPPDDDFPVKLARAPL